MRYVTLNLDGLGRRRYHVWDMPAIGDDYWSAVTNVPCPVCGHGTIRWHEAGHVPGYRICDACLRHFLAGGTDDAPMLIRMGDRKGV